MQTCRLHISLCLFQYFFIFFEFINCSKAIFLFIYKLIIKICERNIWATEALTFHCIRPCARTIAHYSPRLEIWHVGKMRQSQMAAVCVKAHRQARSMRDTWCARSKRYVSSTHYQSNQSFHLIKEDFYLNIIQCSVIRRFLISSEIF
jgi:hypothetical protein